MAAIIELSAPKYGLQRRDVPRMFSIPGSVNRSALRKTAISIALRRGQAGGSQ